MMKDVIRDIASGSLPLIGIIAFLTAFILILVRVALMSKKEIKHAENLPLKDDIDVTGSGNQTSSFPELQKKQK
ncbi:MAG: cbb3-type cytochrome c oxidase subunit 3 [Rhodothermales bacterium]|nr:cbb3-type cytochrome c oxidase subunit 3 [Rhodothermales bacterium]